MEIQREEAIEPLSIPWRSVAISRGSQRRSGSVKRDDCAKIVWKLLKPPLLKQATDVMVIKTSLLAGDKNKTLEGGWERGLGRRGERRAEESEKAKMALGQGWKGGAKWNYPCFRLGLVNQFNVEQITHSKGRGEGARTVSSLYYSDFSPSPLTSVILE